MKLAICAVFLLSIVVYESGSSTPSKILNKISSRIFLGAKGESFNVLKSQQSEVKEFRGCEKRRAADACNIITTALFFGGRLNSNVASMDMSFEGKKERKTFK